MLRGTRTETSLPPADLKRSLTRTEASPPDPLFFNNDSQKTIPIRLTPPQLVQVIDERYAGMPGDVVKRSGELTAQLQKADQNTPVSPRLLLAALTDSYMRERPVTEMSILGRWGSGFTHDNHPRVQFNISNNGFPIATDMSLDHTDNQGKRTAMSYLAYGLVQKGDTFLDVGTGYGCVPKHLKEYGVNVTILEPNIENIKARLRSQGEKIETKDILALPVEEYSKQHPDKKFSVVNVCHFFPFYKDDVNTEVLLDKVKPMIRSLSSLTAEEGKLLLGINPIDTEYVSSKSPFYLRPHLERHFQDVTYISAKKFTDEFSSHLSVGGQMGIYKCTHPIRSSQ